MTLPDSARAYLEGDVVAEATAAVPARPSEIDFSTAVTAPYTNQQAFAFSPHLQLPYSWHWIGWSAPIVLRIR
jgi:hypothetical protein